MVKKDPIMRCAALENSVRRKIAQNICYFFFGDREHNPTWREANRFAKLANITQQQARRILHIEHGGILEFMTFVRIVDFFGQSQNSFQDLSTRERLIRLIGCIEEKGAYS